MIFQRLTAHAADPCRESVRWIEWVDKRTKYRGRERQRETERKKERDREKNKKKDREREGERCTIYMLRLSVHVCVCVCFRADVDDICLYIYIYNPATIFCRNSPQNRLRPPTPMDRKRDVVDDIVPSQLLSQYLINFGRPNGSLEV